MPTKNIKGMTDEALRFLLKEAQEEFDRRQRENKERDWLAVQKAIAVFVEKWGWITVIDGYDTITINKGADMNSIGDIDVSI